LFSPPPLKHHIEQINGANNPLEAIELEIVPWPIEMKNAIRLQHPEHLVVVKMAD
jgi:hypothetical protein